MPASDCASRRTHTGGSCFTKDTLRRMMNSTLDFYVASRKPSVLEHEMLKKRFSTTTKTGGMPVSRKKACGRKKPATCERSTSCKPDGDKCVSIHEQGRNNHTTDAGMLKTLQEAVIENCEAVTGSSYCNKKVPPHHWVDSTLNNTLIRHWASSASLAEAMNLYHKPYRCVGSGNLVCVNNVLERFNHTKSMKFSGSMIDVSYTNPKQFAEIFRTMWDYGSAARPEYSRYGYILNGGSGGDTDSWATLYVDRSNHRLEYFHPRGKPVSRDHADHVNAIKDLITNDLQKSSAGKWKTEVSNMPHQEAVERDFGLYHLWYLNRRIDGDSMEKINSRRMRNESVVKRERDFYRLRYDPETAESVFPSKKSSAASDVDDWIEPTDAEIDATLRDLNDPSTPAPATVRIKDLKLRRADLPRESETASNRRSAAKREALKRAWQRE